jgi:hypothetical protein
MSKSFTVDDAAEISGLTKATIISKIRKKLLQARRTRSYSIQGSDLREFSSSKRRWKRPGGKRLLKQTRKRKDSRCYSLESTSL